MNLTASGSALCSTCFVSGSQNILAPSQFRYLDLSAHAERLGGGIYQCSKILVIPQLSGVVALYRERLNGDDC